MNRRYFLLFFLLPFLGMFAIVVVSLYVNRSFVRAKAQDLVYQQVSAAAAIMTVNLSHFLEEGRDPRDALALYDGEKNIYYMALLDDRNSILAWISQYEGYLPFSRKDAARDGPWIIDSPAGSIFNLLLSFKTREGRGYRLYLGYSLINLEEMTARSNRDLAFLLLSLAAVGIVFSIGLFRIQKGYLAKEREADEEKKEKERLREISALTSAVAHEIKNPLNSLSLLCEFLQKNVPEDLRAELSHGKSEVRKISRVIDRFAGELKPIRPVRDTFLLADVVEEARASLPEDLLRPGVTFRYDEADPPIALRADRDLMSQCLFNLMRNAFEATDAGAVTLSAARGRGKTVIRIQDTGHGIAPGAREHIFDPFFSTKDQGMGLGLYLSRRVIEAHGGSIRLTGEKDPGTTFIIELPEQEHE